MKAPEFLVRQFQQRFGTNPLLFRAPGRVNLIGEHTDYNNGFVMPAAIEFSTWAAITVRNDRKLIIYSAQFEEQHEFELDATPSPQHHWTDYILGVAITLEKAGLRLHGANLMVHGEVPIGSGLSSSAALEVACGFALLHASGLPIELVRLAKLCQQAENEFVGARCGIMDQFISCLGKAGQCLMIDCQSLDYVALPLPPETALVICNSMVKHSLAGGEYNIRRSQCEEGVALLSRFVPGIRSLRDVTPEQLEHYGHKLPALIARRCRHVVSEIQRVRDAAAALKGSDLELFGELMRQSHMSLRDDYEVSCPELDTLVEIASNQPGVYGARMTGGGFGGCTINLVTREVAQTFSAKVAAEYERQTGVRPEIYVTRAGGGVEHVL
jgi:galactokinase